jgi:purine-nucleoside phosphorylase
LRNNEFFNIGNRLTGSSLTGPQLTALPADCSFKMSRMNLFECATEAADFIRKRTPLQPQIAIILGSGLGAIAEDILDSVVTPYAEIPHFPCSTVEGHSGKLVIGSLAGIPVAVMQGRVHGYEGYAPEEVTFPMRVLGRLGIKTVLVTNAAGGIRPEMHPGDLVLLSDHINLLGRNPVSGPNDIRFGQRFFDMRPIPSGSARWHIKPQRKRDFPFLKECI